MNAEHPSTTEAGADDGAQPRKRRPAPARTAPHRSAGKFAWHVLSASLAYAANIAFDIAEDGPEHDKTFRATVLLDGEPQGVGKGRSKKQAEQAAAQATWQQLDLEDGELPPREEARHG